MITPDLLIQKLRDDDKFICRQIAIITGDIDYIDEKGQCFSQGQDVTGIEEMFMDISCQQINMIWGDLDISVNKLETAKELVKWHVYFASIVYETKEPYEVMLNMVFPDVLIIFCAIIMTYLVNTKQHVPFDTYKSERVAQPVLEPVNE